MQIFDIDTELRFLELIEKNGLSMYEYRIAVETFYGINGGHCTKNEVFR